MKMVRLQKRIFFCVSVPAAMPPRGLRPKEILFITFIIGCFIHFSLYNVSGNVIR